uniref:Uncharacterized protein n=1 Tax=Setaria digitata TaxID=48799 RepID=A0A915PDN7_9BILA
MLRKPSLKQIKQKNRDLGWKKVAPLASQEEEDFVRSHRTQSYFNFRKKVCQHRFSKSSK